MVANGLLGFQTVCRRYDFTVEDENMALHWVMGLQRLLKLQKRLKGRQDSRISLIMQRAMLRVSHKAMMQGVPVKKARPYLDLTGEHVRCGHGSCVLWG